MSTHLRSARQEVTELQVGGVFAAPGGVVRALSSIVQHLEFEERLATPARRAIRTRSAGTTPASRQHQCKLCGAELVMEYDVVQGCSNEKCERYYPPTEDTKFVRPLAGHFSQPTDTGTADPFAPTFAENVHVARYLVHAPDQNGWRRVEAWVKDRSELSEAELSRELA
jgi:hypothetical protein